MPSADFTSCRAKLARSKEKFDALDAEARVFLEREPCRAVPLKDPETGAPGFRAEIVEEPSDDWWLDVGEIGYQARSALDHLVRQLAVDSGHVVTDKTRTQFPIFLDSDEYRRGGSRSYRERMLVGVASRHRKIIDDYQPYHRKRGARDPLALLRAISDRDKHREGHVAVAVAKRIRVEPREVNPSIPFMGWEYGNPDEPMPIRDGQHLGGTISYTVAGVESYPEIQIEEPLPLTLAFIGDEGGSLTIEDLDRIVLHVSGIIDRFEARISGKRQWARSGRPGR